MLGLKSLFGKESGKPKMLYEELGGKVLIVDHDPLIGRDLGAIFKLQLGLNSDVVESIDDARMLMMTNCYDACVLEPFGQVYDLVEDFIKKSDGHFPSATRVNYDYGNWWEFLRELKDDSIPVHVFSAFLPEDIEMNYMLRQGRDYESFSLKPVKTTKLVCDVRDVIFNYREKSVVRNSV